MSDNELASLINSTRQMGLEAAVIPIVKEVLKNRYNSTNKTIRDLYEMVMNKFKKTIL
jgi:hypothetical protein